MRICLIRCCLLLSLVLPLLVIYPLVTYHIDKARWCSFLVSTTITYISMVRVCIWAKGMTSPLSLFPPLNYDPLHIFDLQSLWTGVQRAKDLNCWLWGRWLLLALSQSESSLYKDMVAAPLWGKLCHPSRRSYIDLADLKNFVAAVAVSQQYCGESSTL